MGARALQHASVRVALVWEGKYVGFEWGRKCVCVWVGVFIICIHTYTNEVAGAWHAGAARETRRAAATDLR